MAKFMGFRCLSCDTLQSEDIEEPISHNLYLSGSICNHCGQIIPTETKSKQLNNYLKSRIYASDELYSASNASPEE